MRLYIKNEEVVFLANNNTAVVLRNPSNPERVGSILTHIDLREYKETTGELRWKKNIF